jgi:hypothetical protein
MGPRNFGIIVAFVITFCTIQLIAAEYTSAEQSRGDVVVFRQSGLSKILDEEQPDSFRASAMSKAPSNSSKIERKQQFVGMKSQSSVVTWCGLC